MSMAAPYELEGDEGLQPTVRVAGLLVDDHRILMVEQGRGEECYWLLPGGGVQFGESLTEALRREFLEELGLRVGVYRLLAVSESISPDPSYLKHVLHLVFEVTAPTDVQLEPREDEVLRAAFLSEAELEAADVRPPIGSFLCSCTHRLPSFTEYLGRRW